MPELGSNSIKDNEKGNKSEGFKAFVIAVDLNLPISRLKRTYRYLDGELESPWWELTFVPTKL